MGSPEYSGMTSRLSRAGWLSAAGPSAKARSTFAVTCWTKLDVVPGNAVRAVAEIASTQRMVPPMKTPAPPACV
jgi:hypothetical protein